MQRLRDTKERNGKRNFAIYKTPVISARKSDGNGMADKRVFSPSGLARNLAPLRAAFCGIGFVFMQRRAVVLRARTRAHLYQDYGTSNRQDVISMMNF